MESFDCVLPGYHWVVPLVVLLVPLDLRLLPRLLFLDHPKSAERVISTCPYHSVA